MYGPSGYNTPALKPDEAESLGECSCGQDAEISCANPQCPNTCCGEHYLTTGMEGFCFECVGEICRAEKFLFAEVVA